MVDILIKFRDAEIETYCERLMDVVQTIEQTIPQEPEYWQLMLGELVENAEAIVLHPDDSTSSFQFQFYRRRLDDKDFAITLV